MKIKIFRPTLFQWVDIGYDDFVKFYFKNFGNKDHALSKKGVSKLYDILENHRREWGWPNKLTKNSPELQFREYKTIDDFNKFNKTNFKTTPYFDKKYDAYRIYDGQDEPFIAR